MVRPSSEMEKQSEVMSMTENERFGTALNLLMFNTYEPIGSENGSKTNIASSALFSFVQSKLNAWAAQTLPGIDLSLGINQYEGEHSGGTETSYSYRLTKTLFNDRFKIVVGGEYKTEINDDDDVASNLFNDISLEYLLNARGSRYLKLFRQSGYENVFEGQVTKTGVAYVLKRKLDNLKNLFRFKHSREYILRDSLEKARKKALELQENALDAITHSDEAVDAPVETIDKPTVNRKKEDENENAENLRGHGHLQRRKVFKGEY